MKVLPCVFLTIVVIAISGCSSYPVARDVPFSSNLPDENQFFFWDFNKGEGNYVINSQQDWLNFTNNQTTPAIWQVNFSESTLLVACRGMKGGGGYEINITKIVDYTNLTIVYVQDIDKGHFQQMVTYPCYAVIAEKITNYIEFKKIV